MKQPEPTKAKVSFADRLENPKRKKKKKINAPVEAIAAAAAVELEVEIPETIALEPLQLEDTQPLPLPEIPVEQAAELVPEVVVVEEAIPEPELEIIIEPKPQSFEYNGRIITQDGHKFFYNGIEFISLDVAQKYIDNFAITPAKRLPGASRSS